MGLGKRRPWGPAVAGARAGWVFNAPNVGVAKGARAFVRGTVGEVKRFLAAAGVAAKRVRLSCQGGVVEVLFTQQHGHRGRQSPLAAFWADPAWRGRVVAHPSPYRRRCP